MQPARDLTTLGNQPVAEVALLPPLPPLDHLNHRPTNAGVDRDASRSEDSKGAQRCQATGPENGEILVVYWGVS